MVFVAPTHFFRYLGISWYKELLTFSGFSLKGGLWPRIKCLLGQKTRLLFLFPLHVWNFGHKTSWWRFHNRSEVKKQKFVWGKTRNWDTIFRRQTNSKDSPTLLWKSVKHRCYLINKTTEPWIKKERKQESKVP